MKLSTYLRGYQQSQQMRSDDISITAASEGPHPEVVMIRTSSGLMIPVHSSVLASASPVFEVIVERRREKGRLSKPIPILGVPSQAVSAFVGLLCSERSETYCEQSDEAMDKYGMHLMVLSHVYRVKWLKDLCEVQLAVQLTVDSVVDVLQLAMQCDVPKLRLQCMKLLRKEFAAVEKTEGWIFLQDNDPWLELEILKFLEEEDMRRKRRRRKMEEQEAYLQLSGAMECLQHICTEGCTGIGPYEPSMEKAPDSYGKKKGLSCPNYATCRVLQNLIRHLAACRAKRAACPKCRRVSDLLRLHASTCDLNERCKVPLCEQFKVRMQTEGRGDDGRWRILAKKVASVKVMSFLAKRREQDMASKML